MAIGRLLPAIGTAIWIMLRFRCFLHIDMVCRTRRGPQFVVLSTLTVVPMVPGTIWTISNRHARMMSARRRVRLLVRLSQAFPDHT